MTVLKKWMDRTPDEHVILQSASQQNLPVKGTELIKQIKLSCGSGQFAIMRSGDTIFWYHIDSPELVHVTIFSLDSAPQMAINMQEFCRALSIAEYKYWYVETGDQTILQAVKLSKIPTKIEQTPGKLGAPMYRVIAAALPTKTPKVGKVGAV